MEEEESLRTAKYIWSILRTNPGIVMSWGLDTTSVKAIRYGIEFHVEGFKHKGNVQVKLNRGADLFEIYLYDENGNMVKSETEIYADNLIGVIDEAVEHTEDYEERVNATYPLFSHAQVIIMA